jgi:hypothetical protein
VLGRQRRRWDLGIRMHIGETGWRGVVWFILLAQDRDRFWALVDTAMKLRVLEKRS